MSLITNIDNIKNTAALGVSVYIPSGNVDGLYGPYTAPSDKNEWYIEYVDGNGDTKRLPDKTSVYETKYDYAKALATLVMQQKNTFNLGQKISIVGDDNKPLEHTVVYNEDGNLELIDSRYVDIFNINFHSLQTTGAMQGYQVSGKFFNLPESKFITPTFERDGIQYNKIFHGWRFGEIVNSDVILSNDIYNALELVDLSEHYTLEGTEKQINLYGEYIIPEDVIVDFENQFLDEDGTNFEDNYHLDDFCVSEFDYYDDENKIVYKKPEDWDSNYKTYYYINDNNNEIKYYTFQEVAWLVVYTDDTNHDNMTRGDDYCWSSYNTKIGTNTNTGVYWNINKEYTNILYNPNQYQYITINDDNYYNTKYVWQPIEGVEGYNSTNKQVAYSSRKWYKLVLKSTFRNTFTNTNVQCINSNFDEYKYYKLYTNPVINSLSMFSNGSLYGDVVYDLFETSLLTAHTGCITQISTELRPPYNRKFEFSHWVVNAYDDNQTSHITSTKTYNKPITSFKLEELKLNTNSNEDKYCDYYKIIPVYKKRNSFAKLLLTTNLSKEEKFGTIEILTTPQTVKTKEINNDNTIINTTLITPNRIGGIDKDGNLFIEPNVSGITIEEITIGEDENKKKYQCFKINIEKYSTIKIKAIPTESQTKGQTPLFLKWTGTIEQENDTIDLNLTGGGFYELKSWFILDGDLMAKVHLLRYSGEFGKIIGVDVGIYGWKYSMLENIDKVITIKDESPTPNYLSYNTTSVFDVNSVQNHNNRTITGLNYVATSRDVNANLTPLFNTQVFTKTIDEDNQLDINGIAYIDITNNENGCYLYINVTNEASHEFVGFGDDDTNYTTEILTNSIKYIRYIEVSAPLDYSFIVNFRKKTNTESSDMTTVKDSFTSLNDMVKDIKMNFSATKNTDTNNTSTINKRAVNPGGINTGLSVGGSVYVGENAFQEAIVNKTTLPIILMEDDSTQQTVYVEVENINDIINNSGNIDIATNNTTINSIINIASQNAGKTSTEELSVSYDTQLNRQSTVTNTSFKNTTIRFNNKVI